MSSDLMINLLREMLMTSMAIAGPVLIVGLSVGLIAAVIQAITSIQEQAISMIPKMIAVAVTLMILAPWMIRKLLAFTQASFERIGST